MTVGLPRRMLEVLRQYLEGCSPSYRMIIVVDALSFFRGAAPRGVSVLAGGILGTITSVAAEHDSNW